MTMLLRRTWSGNVTLRCWEAPGVSGRRSSVAALATCLLFLASLDVTAQGEQRSVLTLYAQRRENPVPLIVDPLLQGILAQRVPGIDYYNEFIDGARFADPEFRHAVLDFLKRKYAGRRFDVLITPSTQALNFLKANRDELFAGVPVVYHTNSNIESAPRPTEVPEPRSTGLTSPMDLARTLTMVTQLQPETKRVFVVSGSSAFDKTYEDLARAQFRAFDGRFEFTYWSGLPMKDLLERVADLPPDSILYPLMLTQDRSGQRYLPFDQIERIAAAANVPVYAWGSPEMGRGVVGGSMYSPEHLAGPLAEVVIRVLGGEKPENIPVASLDLNVSEVDWRQLRRWGISEARVPAGTTVRFREPGLWERYRSYIIGTVILLLLQTTLIAGLLVQRGRRRRVERALRDSEAALRKSYEQTQDLAGRLITAQEAERSRIGRDLHDDVCQRLAVLAMMLSGLKHRLSGSTPQPDLDEVVTTLQERTSTLATDVRNLSHDLHPSVLEHAGLVPVLKAHCDEFARQQKVDVTFSADEGVGSVDGAAALCVYRVTQEALTNTGRHASASAVRVRLTRTAEAIELEVVDNGIGFESGRHTPSGLGLRSIDERVRFNKGTARVESHPGQGTSVFVRVPLSPAATGDPSTAPDRA